MSKTQKKPQATLESFQAIVEHGFQQSSSELKKTREDMEQGFKKSTDDLKTTRKDMDLGFTKVWDELKATRENIEFLLEQVVKSIALLNKHSEQIDKSFELIISHTSKIEDLDKRLTRVEKNMVTKADQSQLMGELKASREEQVTIVHQNGRTSKKVDGHEKRITVVEKKIGIVSPLLP